MKVLTIANRKGGVGKSTCAAHLATEAVKHNIKTIIIDLDPQKTLEEWWKRREEEDIPLVEICEVELSHTIEKLQEKGFDLCIIDTPGDASQNARNGIAVADLVLIPSKPTAPDLSAIGRTIGMVEEHEKKFVFVLTQCIVRAKSTFQASSVLSSFGAVAPAAISNRVSYSAAMGAGTSACQSDRVAEEEISEVWEFISNRLFESSRQKKKKLMA